MRKIGPVFLMVAFVAAACSSGSSTAGTGEAGSSSSGATSGSSSTGSSGSSSGSSSTGSSGTSSTGSSGSSSGSSSGGGCNADAWVGSYQGPVSLIITFSSPPGTPSKTLSWTGTGTAATLAGGCQVSFTTGVTDTSTSNGTLTYNAHSWVLDVNGDTATLVGAQSFSGSETYDGVPVTFSGQAEMVTATLSGTQMTLDWSGAITGTTDGVPWSGAYTATGTETRQ